MLASGHPMQGRDYLNPGCPARAPATHPPGLSPCGVTGGHCSASVPPDALSGGLSGSVVWASLLQVWVGRS